MTTESSIDTVADLEGGRAGSANPLPPWATDWRSLARSLTRSLNDLLTRLQDVGRVTEYFVKQFPASLLI